MRTINRHRSERRGFGCTDPRRLRAGWAAVSAAVALALLGASPAAAAGGAISGKVTGPKAEPLAGVHVSVTREGSLWVAESAADGSYEVGGLQDGVYTVSFEAPGYLRQYYENATSQGRARHVAITGASTRTGIDAQMQLAGSISGAVTDVGGAPLAGIYVTPYAGGRPLPGVKTKADGSYSIGELPQGSYTVRFAAAAPVAGFDRGGGDYLPQFYSDRSTEAAADSVVVTSGAATTGIDALMAAGGQISGLLTDDSGATVDGMLVTAYDASGQQAGAWFTGSDGRFLIDQLPTGTYTLGFTSNTPSASPNEIARYRGGRATLAGASGLSVNAGATTEADEQVIRGGEVSGTVTDEHGTPVERVQAKLLTGGGEYVATAQTGPGGRYEIGGLESGSYVMEFEPLPGFPPAFAGSGNFLSSYFDGAGTLASADPVPVSVGALTAGIDGVLPAGGRLTGTVTAAAGGASLADVTVTAYDASGEYAGAALTATDGTYTLGGLPSGSYRERFSVEAGSPFAPSPGNYAPQYDGGAESLASAEAVAVTAGAAPGVVDAQLHPGATISGVVDDSEGEGIEQETVTAYDADGNYAGSAKTKADGSYTISDLAGGVYRVGFRNAEPNEGRPEYAPQFFKDEPDLSSASGVNLPAGGSVPGVDAQLAAGGQISGKVGEAAGASLLGFDMVVAYDQAGRWVSHAPVGSDGRYVIGGLATGVYRVGFSDELEEGYAPAFYGGSSLASATGVSVALGATTSGIDFDVAREDGSLSGTVQDGALPAPPGTVTAFDPAGHPAGEATTTSGGAYSIGGLAPGFYRLGFTASGASASHFFAGAETLAQSTPVLVVSGAAAEGLRIQLAPPSTPPGAAPAPPAGSSGIAGTKLESRSRTLTQAQKRARAIAACRKLKPSRRARCIAAAKRRFPTQAECRRTYETWSRRHRRASSHEREAERTALRRHGCHL